mgnify:CR=1 FL=1
MQFSDVEGDLSEVLLSQEEIHEKIAVMARQIEADYAGERLLLVGVLRGAVMVMADLARELSLPIEMDWMAVSSYGAGTQSSGVVRILKDLDTDLEGRKVLIVEDIIDSGLTLSWLLGNLRSRGQSLWKSAHCCASRMPRRSTSMFVMLASTFRTPLWSGMDSTMPRSTATCAVSLCLHPTSTRRAG